MDKVVKQHLTRIISTVLRRHTSATIADWIVENTKVGIMPFTYDGHEYQERILRDTSQEVVVRKCSQVGISEVSLRKALALVNVLDPYTVAYTLPTAKFANTFMKTRIDPVITTSDAMRDALDHNNDSAEIKQFRGSFLYLKGAASANAPISIPVDHLIHDELDFCDQEVIGQYTSRLTHSTWKRKDSFSTPTLPAFGIDRAFQNSRRHFNMCKCVHCNAWFIPNYYDHIKIPNYSGDLREMNKVMLTRVRWQEAQLLCPGCGKVPNLMPEHREWVCENPNERFVAAGYQVSPFDAPLVIKPSDLVKASTAYDRSQDFVNFNLGLPAEDAEACFTRDELDKLFSNDEAGSGMHVMAVDVGNVYHFVVGRIDPVTEAIRAVHTEQVPMGRARQRFEELRQKYNTLAEVIDSAPHAETVMALQQRFQNTYAAVYMRSKSIQTHQVVFKEEDKEAAQVFVRQVNVNRNRALDAYMEFVRSGLLSVQDSEEREAIITQHTSMKRVKTYDAGSEEMTYTWQKTDGNDHYHNAFLYLFIAARIRGVSRASNLMPLTTITVFRPKNPLV